jgi:hypothetical protein
MWVSYGGDQQAYQGYSHDDNVDVLFPYKRPKVLKRGVQWTLRRNVPFIRALGKDKIGVDIIRAVIVGFGT